MKKFLLIPIALIPIILLITSIKLTTFNEEFYKKEFAKYDIYAQFQSQDIHEMNSEVLKYLKTGDGNLSFFNERETSHLKDVRILMRNAFIFNYLLIFLFLGLMVFVYYDDKKILIKNMGITFFFGGLATLIITFLFWLLSKLNFLGFFTKFHLIFFTGDTWLFYEGIDKITSLYTLDFFYDAITRVFLATIIAALILMIIGSFLAISKHFYKRHDKV